jgi:hypothetical protein
MLKIKTKKNHQKISHVKVEAVGHHGHSVAPCLHFSPRLGRESNDELTGQVPPSQDLKGAAIESHEHY